jgi:DNA modification methylase
LLQGDKMNYTILQGDNRTTLKTLPDNSIDAIITDPPYGIDFLGKSWDANTGALETYQECLRVLKPGGHILAFSAARTYHHLAVTLEAAGFEIRDQIMWIYSSGFPKSQDIGRQIQKSLGVKETKKHKNNAPRIGGVAQGEEIKQQEQVVVTDPEAKAWSGWGTALKPAHEPIALARKPIKLSIAKNCQKYGVGALNIDAARVGDSGGQGAEELGRFPSNVVGDIPDYQKYFYCPKVSRKERHIGFETTDIPKHPEGMFEHGGGDLHKRRDTEGVITIAEMLKEMGGYFVDKSGNETSNGGIDVWVPHLGLFKAHGIKTEYENWHKANGTTSTANVGNNHPTVKPIELMKYLIKLITPPGGTVLDPFNGSGSTGCAAVELGHTYIGCELDPNYVKIATQRIEAWYKSTRNPAEDIFDDN